MTHNQNMNSISKCMGIIIILLIVGSFIGFGSIPSVMNAFEQQETILNGG